PGHLTVPGAQSRPGSLRTTRSGRGGERTLVELNALAPAGMPLPMGPSRSAMQDAACSTRRQRPGPAGSTGCPVTGDLSYPRRRELRSPLLSADDADPL